MFKKILASILMVVILFVSTASVKAADINSSGGTGTTPVTISAAATTFCVTVPTELSLSFNGDGVATASTNAKIVNKSAGAVKITNVSVNAAEGWEILAFDEDAMASYQVNRNGIALKINGVGTTAGNGNLSLGSTVIMGKNDTNSDEFPITYTGLIPSRSASIPAGTTVANVVFTLAWNV